MQAKIKSYAKLNLALNITGKTSSLHKIESIVAFNSLHDEIFIKKIKSKSHNIMFTGRFSKNINRKNTVSKLLEILEKKELLKNLKFKVADGFFVFFNHSLEEVFRLANKIHPGTLEKNTQTNTLIAAIDLLKSSDPISSLELMIKTLSLVSESLEANITDIKSNPLSKQMIEHFRTHASRVLQEKSYSANKLNTL